MKAGLRRYCLCPHTQLPEIHSFTTPHWLLIIMQKFGELNLVKIELKSKFGVNLNFFLWAMSVHNKILVLRQVTNAQALGTRLSYVVCCVIGTVCLGYSRFRKAESGVGLDWGCLVSPVWLTHTDILDLTLWGSLTVTLAKVVRLIHICIMSVRLTYIYISSVRPTQVFILSVRLTHIYIPSVRLTHIHILRLSYH